MRQAETQGGFGEVRIAEVAAERVDVFHDLFFAVEPTEITRAEIGGFEARSFCNAAGETAFVERDSCENADIVFLTGGE